MRSSWIGIFACVVVLYYGVVQASSTPAVLLNTHALILVVGGTFAIMLLTYSWSRLLQVADFVLFGFLFRARREEVTFARDLLTNIDMIYGKRPVFEESSKVHRFLRESIHMLKDPAIDTKTLHATLLDRRNAVKRKYLEDAKILNNIAKYPPHLGLLGAASGMIEMMSGLGKVGTESIGLAMATALTATLWGVGLNNFIFLPLGDNATKAAEDELFMRDIVIECCMMMKRGLSHETVVNSCINKMSMFDRVTIAEEYYAGDTLKNPASNKEPKNVA